STLTEFIKNRHKSGTIDNSFRNRISTNIGQLFLYHTLGLLWDSSRQNNFSKQMNNSINLRYSYQGGSIQTGMNYNPTEVQDLNQQAQIDLSRVTRATLTTQEKISPL